MSKQKKVLKILALILTILTLTSALIACGSKVNNINTEPNQTLTVIKEGTGLGTVTSTLEGINCGSDCAENYALDTSVMLNASATTGSKFAGWTGCDMLYAGITCQVSMISAKTVKATFESTVVDNCKDTTQTVKRQDESELVTTRECNKPESEKSSVSLYAREGFISLVAFLQGYENPNKPYRAFKDSAGISLEETDFRKLDETFRVEVSGNYKGANGTASIETKFKDQIHLDGDQFKGVSIETSFTSSANLSSSGLAAELLAEQYSDWCYDFAISGPAINYTLSIESTVNNPAIDKSENLVYIDIYGQDENGTEIDDSFALDAASEQWSGKLQDFGTLCVSVLGGAQDIFDRNVQKFPSNQTGSVNIDFRLE